MYKYISQDAGTITFASAKAPSNFIRFSATPFTASQNGIRFRGVRTNTLVSTEQVVKQCEDACATKAVVNRTVRILTSGLQGDATQLIADLEAVIAVIKAKPDYFNGFLPGSGEVIDLFPGVD